LVDQVTLHPQPGVLAQPLALIAGALFVITKEYRSSWIFEPRLTSQTPSGESSIQVSP
jgi:hypothetical protein